MFAVRAFYSARSYNGVIKALGPFPFLADFDRVRSNLSYFLPVDLERDRGVSAFLLGAFRIGLMCLGFLTYILFAGLKLSTKKEQHLKQLACSNRRLSFLLIMRQRLSLYLSTSYNRLCLNKHNLNQQSLFKYYTILTSVLIRLVVFFIARYC